METDVWRLSNPLMFNPFELANRTRAIYYSCRVFDARRLSALGLGQSRFAHPREQKPQPRLDYHPALLTALCSGVF